MTRIAWMMKLKPGGEEVYERTHAEMSTEMSERIRTSGARNFSIFRHDLDLFAYLELDDGAAPPGDADPEDEMMWEWWRRLAPYMETEPSAKPLMWPLVEVFHQD